MVNSVEELLKIEFHAPTVARCHVAASCFDGLMRASTRTKTVAVVREQRVEDRCELLQQCLLDQAIYGYDNLGSTTLGEPPSVLVNIGAIASVQRSYLPDALAKFHQQCPQCRTRVIPGLSMEMVNLVDAGEIDMAVIIRPPFSLQSDLRWTTLALEPYRLIVPRDLEGEDWSELLSSQPFIRYDRSSFGGRQVDRFLRQMHFTLREVCELEALSFPELNRLPATLVVSGM